MSEVRKRVFECRFILAVVVNLANPRLADIIAAAGQTSSVAEVVSSEVVSNLESLPYVEAVIISRL